MSTRLDSDDLFAPPPRERGLPMTAIAIAGVAVAVLLAVLLLMGHRKGAGTRGEQPLAADAQSLHFTALEMSESSSLSGGKDTYIDGRITNAGSKTVTGVTVQVFFRNSEGLAPQIETLPLTLIRTRDPYIDTEPVSAAPLAPGASQEFRLIFENIGANWNQSLPDIHVISIQTR